MLCTPHMKFVYPQTSRSALFCIPPLFQAVREKAHIIFGFQSPSCFLLVAMPAWHERAAALPSLHCLHARPSPERVPAVEKEASSQHSLCRAEPLGMARHELWCFYCMSDSMGISFPVKIQTSESQPAPAALPSSGSLHYNYNYIVLPHQKQRLKSSLGWTLFL